MSPTPRIRMAATVIALLAFVGSAAVIMGTSSEGTYSSSYGTVYEIDLAPGFSYTYSPTYPSDLTVTTSIEKYESTGITAAFTDSSNKTLKVTVKDGITSGSYDLVLKASSTTGSITQTAYQHIRFNIVSGLSVSGSINDIIKGASVNLTLQGTSEMGDVVWTVKSGTTLPSGLTLSGNTVSGTPTAVGSQTVSLTATAAGETKDLIIDFTVYNVIVGGSNETITSYGESVSSSVIVQTGNDLGVTWTVTSGTLPSGFTLNSSTGVVSGSSSTLNSTSVTITGASSHGPAQTTTKTITIRSEPALSLTSDGEITVYSGSGTQTAQITATSGTSAITWSVSSATGVSISNSGLLSVTESASSGTVTVTAETQYGQTATIDQAIYKEATAAISGSVTLSCVAGSSMTGAYTTNISGTWSVDATSAPSGVTISISDKGILSISGSSPCDGFEVTVKLTTASGQTVEKTVTCQVVSQLIFTSAPTNGLIVVEA